MDERNDERTYTHFSAKHTFADGSELRIEVEPPSFGGDRGVTLNLSHYKHGKDSGAYASMNVPLTWEALRDLTQTLFQTRRMRELKGQANTDHGKHAAALPEAPKDGPSAPADGSEGQG